MTPDWSPHPRYRLYTRPVSYAAALKSLLPGAVRRTETTARLEEEICLRHGARAALCVPMARTGLYLALREMIRPGQMVIMSPLTVVDVVNMVLLAGGVPVFADILRQSCGIDPAEVDSLIDHRTGAVLITHLHGESADAHLLRGICRARGVPLIEDAAQAFGAVENGRRLGTIGELGIYSLGVYKNINAWRGGVLVSPDAALIDKIRRRMDRWPELPARRLLGAALRGLLTDLATWPPFFASFTYGVVRYGYLHDIRAINRRLDPEYGAMRLSTIPSDYLGRMTGTLAELAIGQLDRIDADTEARIRRAARYHEGLAGLDALITPRRREKRAHIYTSYPIQHPRRNALLRYALARGRDFAAQHLRNCADLPEFNEYYRDCPNARAASRELILLPTYPCYPMQEVERNIRIIRDFVRSEGPSELAEN